MTTSTTIVPAPVTRRRGTHHDEHTEQSPGRSRLESDSIAGYALPLYQALIESVFIPFELPLPLE